MRTANVKMAMASHEGPPVSVFESMFQLRSDQRTDAAPISVRFCFSWFVTIMIKNVAPGSRSQCC